MGAICYNKQFLCSPEKVGTSFILEDDADSEL